MGILSSLISPVTELAGKLLDKSINKQEFAHQVATMAENNAQEIAKAQISVNNTEAKGNWYQAGWRPSMGYVGVLGIAAPVIGYLAQIIGWSFDLDVSTFPVFDSSYLTPIVFGMLGLGTMRTVEKSRK